MHCRNCNQKSIKHGIRKNKYVWKQVYFCKHCNSFFTELQEVSLIYQREVLGQVCNYFCRGKSYQEISQLINQERKMSISKSTIHRWITKIKDGTWQRLY